MNEPQTRLHSLMSAISSNVPTGPQGDRNGSLMPSAAACTAHRLHGAPARGRTGANGAGFFADLALWPWREPDDGRGAAGACSGGCARSLSQCAAGTAVMRRR